MQVKEVMTRNPEKIGPGDPVKRAAEVIRQLDLIETGATWEVLERAQHIHPNLC